MPTAHNLNWLAYDLPTPTVITIRESRTAMYWALDGFFATKGGKAYLIDVKSKIGAILGDYEPIDGRPQITSDSHRIDRVYRLAEFGHIPDHRKKIPGRSRQEINAHRFLDSLDLYKVDQLFEATRHHAYALKEAGRLSYEAVLDVVERTNREVFSSKWTHSDARAKAKAIYCWTLEHYRPQGRQRKTQTDEELFMNRSENMTAINEQRKREAKAAVKGAVEALKFLQEKITVTAVAKQAGTSRDTARKYLRELGEI